MTRHDFSLVVLLSHRVRLPEWRPGMRGYLEDYGPNSPPSLTEQINCLLHRVAMLLCSLQLFSYHWQSKPLYVTRPISCTACVPNGFCKLFLFSSKVQTVLQNVYIARKLRQERNLKYTYPHLPYAPYAYACAQFEFLLRSCYNSFLLSRIFVML